METFIARMIEKQAKVSTDKGVAKYEAYFVRTRLYEGYRDDVDSILRIDGYENCIVAK